MSSFKDNKNVEKDAEDSVKPKNDKFKGKKRTNNKSDKKNGRDENRMEVYRGHKSERTTQENRDALFERLFFGYRNVNEAMKSLPIQAIAKTLVIPISTRSAGFIIRSLVWKFVKLGLTTSAEAKSLAAALYRITLLQIDLKLEEAMAIQHSRNLELNAFDYTDVSGSYRRALNMMGANFSPLVNYISALGYIKTAGKCYLPRHPKLTTDIDPYYVRFTNLRTIVEGLSCTMITPSAKLAFKARCPIPTATWIERAVRRTITGEETPAECNLSNPDSIIPSGYAINEVREDIGLISVWVEKIGRKFPKYVSTGGIDWKGPGLISQLVSNEPASIYCPSWNDNLELKPIAGEFSDFHSPESMSEAETYMGVVYMTGEVKYSTLAVPECASFRSKYSACKDVDLEYATVMQNLLN